MPLTVRQIDATPPTSRLQRLWDSGGLYLEIPPSGSRRWRLKYRVARREKLLSLGLYPTVSLKDARRLRDDAKRLLQQGIDPSAHRQAQRQGAAEFEVLAREWHAGRSQVWAPSHTKRVLELLQRDVFPTLGRRDPSTITAPELLTVLRRIEARGAGDTAHRARRIVGQVLRYGIATGRAERDVAADLKGALKPVTHGHFAAPIEAAEIRSLLLALDAYQGTVPWVGPALRLAPLLFVRPGELRKMEWGELDLKDGMWVVPATKTKTKKLDHLVPLATQAVDMLRDLKPLTGSWTYVFPGARDRRRPLSNGALSVALRRMGVTEDEATVHGLRATARTVLDERLGFRPDIIEHQLGHDVRGPLGRAYNRTQHLDERRRMMQAWADHLDELRHQGA